MKKYKIFPTTDSNTSIKNMREHLDEWTNMLIHWKNNINGKIDSDYVLLGDDMMLQEFLLTYQPLYYKLTIREINPDE